MRSLARLIQKLEKAHSSLLDQDKKEVVLTCDVGSTYDLINESFYEPIIVAPTNPSCSTSTSSSSDGFTCDASLMVENETLKKEVNELTHALGNAYGGDVDFSKVLGYPKVFSQQRGIRLYPQERQGSLCHSQD